MPTLNISDIISTGLTVNGKTILSGNSSNNILTISGSTGAIMTVTDTNSVTLLSVATTGGTTNFSVTTGGTRIHNFLFDSNNSTGTTGQVLSTTNTGVTWVTAASGGTSSGVDVYVTGGTYSSGATTFRNNTGGTFTVSGYYTGDTDTHITGASQSNNNLIFTDSTGGTTTYIPNAATGGTYNNSTGTVTLLGSGSLSNITGFGSLTGTTLYSADGSLSNNRVVNTNAKTLSFSSTTNPNELVISGYTTFINTNIIDVTSPAALVISGINTTSYNMISASGSVNNYLQINVQNKNSGTSGSSDVVATNDTGTEVLNYVNMGINSSTHSSQVNALGGPNDAYLYSTGRELIIGNATTGTTSNIRIFGGGFSGSSGTTEIFISGGGSTVGFGTVNPTHTVHISAATNPVRIQGIQNSTDTLYLTVDANGVMHSSSSVVLTGTVGTNTQITFNNNGIMSGDSNYTWTPANNTLIMSGLNTSIILSGITTEPSATPSGLLRIYTKSIAGKMCIKTIGPSGLDTPIQNAIWRNNTVFFTAGPAAGLWTGTIGANLGTPTAYLPTLSATNVVMSMMRTSRFPTVVTTANQQVGTRTEAIFYRSNNSSVGGFFFTTRFNLSSWTAGDRLFIGFSTGTTAVVTVNPSGLTNTCAFAADANDTGFTFMTATNVVGSTTKAAITGQPAFATGNAYAAYIFCKPNDTVIYYRLDNLSSGTTIVDTSTSTTLPLNTAALVAHVAIGNAANVAAGNAVIGINRIYIETDI